MKIYDSVNFIAFYDKVKNQTMSMQLAYRLSCLHRKAKNDEEFYQEGVRAILQKYAELDEQGNFIPTEDGKGIKIQPEQQLPCLDEITKLQNTESEIENGQISIAELQNLEVSPNDLEGIMPFIKEEE